MRAPLAPMGWPRATAPPFTLTFSGLSLSWRVTAMAATAKASLSSTRSTSLLRSHPVFASSFSTASTGAIMTHFGSTPLTACATIRAMGCLPSRAALRSLVTMSAAAPDRKSTRLNSSHTEIYTLSLHDALPISLRLDAADGLRDDPRDGLLAEPCGVALAGDDERCGSVVGAGRIAGGDGAVFLECRLQLRERFE